MIPIVVDSFPINGQEGIELNEHIRIVFNGAVAPINFEDIEVRNLNKSEMVDFDYTHEEDTVTIVVKDRNAVGANLLCGLTRYQVTIKDVYIPSPQQQKTMAVLSFTTKVESVADFHVEDIPDDFAITNFKMISSSPANEAKNVSPKYIKLIFNDDINKHSVYIKDEIDADGKVTKKQNIYLFKNSPEFIEDALLLKELEYGDTSNLVPVLVDCKIIDNELYLIPIIIDENTGINSMVELESNSQYTVLVKNITSEINMNSGKYIITFTTIPSPLYIDPSEIISTSYFSSITNGSKTMEDIYDMINRYSMDAENIAEEAGTTSLITWANTTDSSVSSCVTNYVRYKTLYNLVYDRYIMVVSASEDKKLSDLEISYANKPNYLKSLLDDLWSKLNGAEEEIKNFGETVQGIGIFIKGENVDATYDFMDRTFKDYEGNRYWNFDAE